MNNKEYNKEYYIKNREARKLNSKNWRAKNPEKNKATREKWLLEHPTYYKDKMKTYRPRATQVARDWRKRNPDGAKNAYYSYQYGITLIQYNELLAKQNGVCAICRGINVNGRGLSVDHNHLTGAIRGLLCTNCNASIGGMRDSVEILANAIKYLELNK